MASDGTPWRTLHAGSVVVNLIPRAWRLVRQFWPAFLFWLFGRDSSVAGVNPVDLAFVLVFFATAFASTLVHYLTLRYRVVDGRLEIRSGLLNRQVRVIDPERIQNLQLVRNVFHRLSNLVEVQIETASGTEVEGLLSALSVEDAEELVAALEAARHRAAPTPEAPVEDVVIHNDARDLLWFGATGSRIAGVFVLLGVGFELLSWVEPEGVPALLQGAALAVSALTLLSGAWVIGVVGDLVAHWDFTVVHRGDALVATEGLFTKRRVELRSRKIQLVTVEQPLLRRVLGFGSLRIETAAAATVGGTRQSEAMVPVVETGDVPRALAEIAPGAAGRTWTAPLRPPHRGALHLALARAVVQAAVITGALSAFAWPWGLVGLLALPALVTGAIIDFRNQGFLVTDAVIVSRTGFWNRRTHLLYRNKLQALDVIQGPVARLWGLGQLHLQVAGTTVALPLLAWDEVEALLLELSPAVHLDAVAAEA